MKWPLAPLAHPPSLKPAQATSSPGQEAAGWYLRASRWLPVILLACAVALPAAAAQWKWRDAQGRLHISDMPPPASVPESSILQRPAQRKAGDGAAAASGKPGLETPASEPAPASAGTESAAPPSTAASSATPLARGERELAERRKAEAEARAAREMAEAQLQKAQRADNCRRATQALATLESGQRIARVNDKGEREILSDSQRASETARAREVMASDCR
jgi:hypothetical protein